MVSQILRDCYTRSKWITKFNLYVAKVDDMLSKMGKKLVFASSLLVTILFGVVTFNQLKIGDYQFHIRLAQELSEFSYVHLRANILFERLLLIVKSILPFNYFARVSVLWKQIIDLKAYDISALIVIIISFLATFFIVLLDFYRGNQSITDRSKRYIIMVFSFVVLLVGPLFLFTYPDRQYFGYITGNPYHNPSFLVMRPLALLFFLFICKRLYEKSNWLDIFLGSFVFILATLAKPNFTLSFIPSVFITVMLLRFREIKKINIKLLIIAMVVVPVSVLLAQYTIMYTGNQGDRIIFSPFQAILIQVPNIGSVVFFTILSIVFPILTLLLYWKTVRNELPFQLAWVNFGVSILMAYLLAEQSDTGSINFWWTPMIAVFLLFIVSIRHYLKEILSTIELKRKANIKEIVLGGFLSLHLICGILFYISSVAANSPVK
jgi:hypothetical protein